MVAVAVTGCQNQSQQQSYSAVNSSVNSRKHTNIRKVVFPLTRQIKDAEVIERNKAAQLKQAQSEMLIAPLLAMIAEDKPKKAWEINMKMLEEIMKVKAERNKEWEIIKMLKEIMQVNGKRRSIHERRIAEMREEKEETEKIGREAREDLEKRIERVNAAEKALEAARGTVKQLCIAKKKAQEARMARKNREEREANMKEEMKMIAGEEMKRQGLTEMGVEATEEAVQKMLNKPNLPLKIAKKISGYVDKVFKKINLFHKKEQQQLGLGTRG
ncbi:hypothetical protein [Candidatus Cardinium hertigii]|uniref:hypothetical protein n=1 Tax=Candidatus Cardinium hertigii TaxID=247481 RepID=UPI0013A54203|nr:hypothetical protein [Candidatus Cardinium hertigii]